jgi:hypothetical protein
MVGSSNGSPVDGCSPSPGRTLTGLTRSGNARYPSCLSPGPVDDRFWRF